jgi:hypothetical protein
MKKPVLFLIFNRPDTTQIVFDEIKKAKPPRLYVAADGSRKDKEGEMEKCQQTREIIKQVDWQCEVKTLFREENLGCGKAISSGIDWFFENEEDGIILEDDCVPEQSFFGFCEKMLDFYKDDERIMMISGTNYDIDASNYEFSYFFANYYTIWGWATWRRAWKLYDRDIKNWDDFKNRKQLEYLFSDKKIADYYSGMVDFLNTGFDTWDIQWWITCIVQYGLAVVPRENLISNIGWAGIHKGNDDDYFKGSSTVSIDLTNLKHPSYVMPDIDLNIELYRKSHAQLDLTKSEADLIKTELELAELEVHSIKTKLNNVYESREYKLILKFQKFVKLIIPVGSLRRKVAVLFWRIMNKLMHFLKIK